MQYYWVSFRPMRVAARDASEAVYEAFAAISEDDDSLEVDEVEIDIKSDDDE